MVRRAIATLLSAIERLMIDRDPATGTQRPLPLIEEDDDHALLTFPIGLGSVFPRLRQPFSEVIVERKSPLDLPKPSSGLLHEFVFVLFLGHRLSEHGTSQDRLHLAFRHAVFESGKVRREYF